MSKPLRSLLVFVMLFIVTLACSSQAPASIPTPPSAIDSLATDTPTPPPPTYTPTPASSQTPPPTEIVLSADVLAGLVFRTSNAEAGDPALWQLSENGAPTVILDVGEALFSPVYGYATYYDEGLWVVDFKQKTKQKTKFGSSLGWYSSDQLIVVRDQEVLEISLISSEMNSITAFAGYGFICSTVSPTNRFAIMLPGDGPVHSWVEFYPEKFITGNLPAVWENQRATYCPSWSPDGNYAALPMTGYEGDRWNSGIGVIDLIGETGTIFHQTEDNFFSFAENLGLAYDPRYFTDNEYTYTTWASDNQHIAFATQAEDEIISFWVSTIDGQTEYQLPNWPIWNPAKPWLAYWDFEHDPTKPELWIMESNGDNAQMVRTRSGGNATEAYLSTFWSPDGEFLLYQDIDGTLWLTDFDTWQAHQVAIDITGELVSWIPLLKITLSDLVALPTPIPFSCPNAPASRLQVGQTARVTVTGSGGTRLRSSPDVLPDNILASLVEGQEFEIIGGPVCSERPGRTDAYVYWEISLPERNLTGWVAEGDFEAYYIEPWP